MEVFYKKNKAPLFRPIPITKEEYIAQNKEENLSKKEIIFKIETLLEQMDENIRKNYHAIKSKNRSELLIILQEVTNLFNIDNELDYHDDLGYPGITQQEF
ncbi:9361_t:CDS:1 [Entrophospora sp. SA101]|nr:4290_t:CDS:1 [Entrophospora sp. SA101]CAJ0886002.1 9361_t:CDS:1 [Entrophospora sp. SA101]